MIESRLEDVFSDENIGIAFSYLAEKKDTCGTDGILLSELPDYWKFNKDKIVDSVFTETYKVGIVRQTDVLSSSKKRRTVSTMNSVDRLLGRALLQTIAPKAEELLSDRCFAYRSGFCTRDMAETAARYMEAGNEWVLEIDVKSFFDTIPHDRLRMKTDSYFSDKRMMRLISAFIRCKVDDDGDIHYLNQGLLQGSPLSPLLSNLYLTEFDKEMEALYGSYCRYGDDVRIYTATIHEAEQAKKGIEKSLIEEGLRVNQQKSGVYTGINRPCLGYEFYEKGGHVYTQKIINKSKEVYSKWKQDSVRKTDQHYHIVNDGILTKKDFTILFENENGKYFLPIETMDSLSVYSSVTFSSGFFRFASNEHLFIDMIDQTGARLGTFVPERMKGDYKVEMSQIKLLNDEKRHLRLARKLQNANIFNLRANLRYYDRRKHSLVLKEAIGFMTEILEKVKKVSTIDNILMFEAQARQKYYACFNEILNDEDFRFEKRTRRPPADPLNAMISFGNTLLYTRFANEIYRSSLDIRFGILHNSAKRAQSLNLDMADLFKPILIDRTIFTLVNRRMLGITTDFRAMDGGGIYLSDNGKRVFIKELERKLYQKVKIGNETKTYEQLMRDEVRNLSAYFRNGHDYKPYRYVN